MKNMHYICLSNMFAHCMILFTCDFQRNIPGKGYVICELTKNSIVSEVYRHSDVNKWFPEQIPDGDPQYETLLLNFARVNCCIGFEHGTIMDYMKHVRGFSAPRGGISLDNIIQFNNDFKTKYPNYSRLEGYKATSFFKKISPGERGGNVASCWNYVDELFDHVKKQSLDIAGVKMEKSPGTLIGSPQIRTFYLVEDCRGNLSLEYYDEGYNLKGTFQLFSGYVKIVENDSGIVVGIDITIRPGEQIRTLRFVDGGEDAKKKAFISRIRELQDSGDTSIDE